MSGSLFQKLSGSLVDRTEVLYDNFVFHLSVIQASQNVNFMLRECKLT